MAAAFNDVEAGNEYITSLRKAITGKKANYKCAAHPYNKIGIASGELRDGRRALFGLGALPGYRLQANSEDCYI